VALGQFGKCEFWPPSRARRRVRCPPLDGLVNNEEILSAAHEKARGASSVSRGPLADLWTLGLALPGALHGPVRIEGRQA
jgi:hypothetical protein